MRPLREDGSTVLKQDEHIGRAVVVDVLDRSHLVVRRVVELLDEIDAVVEIAIRLPPDQRTAFVVLVNIRATVEVAVDGDFREPPLTIVGQPEIRPAVSVPILRAGEASGWP